MPFNDDNKIGSVYNLEDIIIDNISFNGIVTIKNDNDITLDLVLPNDTNEAYTIHQRKHQLNISTFDNNVNIKDKDINHLIYEMLNFFKVSIISRIDNGELILS